MSSAGEVIDVLRNEARCLQRPWKERIGGYVGACMNKIFVDDDNVFNQGTLNPS